MSRSGLYKSRGVADWVGWETGPGPVRTAVVKLGQVSAQASEQGDGSQVGRREQGRSLSVTARYGRILGKRQTD